MPELIHSHIIYTETQVILGDGCHFTVAKEVRTMKATQPLGLLYKHVLATACAKSHMQMAGRKSTCEHVPNKTASKYMGE